MTNPTKRKIATQLFFFVLIVPIILNDFSSFKNLSSLWQGITYLLNILLLNFLYKEAFIHKESLELYDLSGAYLIWSFVFLILIIVNHFSLIYYSLYQNNNLHFQAPEGEILGRLDFLYFSLVTFATVGYGDIYAKTTTARMLVSIEILESLLTLVIFVSNFDKIKKDMNRE